MKVVRKVKENQFIIWVVIAYAAIFVMRPDMGATAVQNSVYYIKEMVLIMPVIFVLTALLDLWVPKEKIIKYLGREARTRGIVLSLVLGSISAGPIYAAFPLCVMLHKKGASVRNLVVILSAWAVIKVPMLLNELKFLGFEFMAVRWVLTVISIVIISGMAAKLVKENDLPQTEADRSGLSVDRSACIGCSLCKNIYPELFYIRDKKAFLKAASGAVDREKLRKAADSCPVMAISLPDVQNP